LPDAPDQIYASMRNYVFSTQTLIDVVCQDAEARESEHDMGRDSCFFAKEQSWRTALARRSLLSWTNTSSGHTAKRAEAPLLL
jgi:hypothetical protein